MTDLVFATYNPHKISEIKDLFTRNKADLPGLDQFTLLNLTDIGFSDDIPETGNTIEINASIKAWTVFNRFGANCFADDTALEVEALGGRPGVHSARFAGEDKRFDKNIDRLLFEMKTELNRKARFRTVIALILNGKEFLFEGTVEGRIIDGRRGTEGFGYDPVFVPDGYDHTFAEMSLEQKNRISHRFEALRKMMSFLSLSPLSSLNSPLSSLPQ